MTEEQVYSLCEAVADIAFIAGKNNYYSGDSRKDIADFIGWAKEFEKFNEGIEWGVNSDLDYLDAIMVFTKRKIA